MRWIFASHNSPARTKVVFGDISGDEFHLTNDFFSSWPVRVQQVSSEDREALVSLGKRLEKAVAAEGEHLLWTPYAGAWQGNFDYLRLRHLTEEADAILRSYVRLDSVEAWRDFNVEYSRFMKIGRERPGTVRGPWPDRDRT